MKKVERFTPAIAPPSRACGICRNRMNQMCVEVCAPDGKYEHFDPNMRRTLDMLPVLTIEEYRELNGKMKGEWLFILMQKLMEAQNGKELRSYPYRTRSRRLLTDVHKQNLLPDIEE